MTIKEYENFQNQNNKLYRIEHNSIFLPWLKYKKDNGYKLLLDVK